MATKAQLKTTLNAVALRLSEIQNYATSHLTRINMGGDRPSRRYVSDILREISIQSQHIIALIEERDPEPSALTFNLVGWVKHDDGKAYQAALLWNHRGAINWHMLGNRNGYLVVEFYSLEGVRKFTEENPGAYFDMNNHTNVIWLSENYVFD